MAAIVEPRQSPNKVGKETCPLQGVHLGALLTEGWGWKPDGGGTRSGCSEETGRWCGRVFEEVCKAPARGREVAEENAELQVSRLLKMSKANIYVCEC